MIAFRVLVLVLLDFVLYATLISLLIEKINSCCRPAVSPTAERKQAKKSPDVGTKDTPKPVSHRPTGRGAKFLKGSIGTCCR